MYSLVPSLCQQDCPTRWGSKQKIIERVLEQANAIKRALDDRKHQHLNLTWQDIAVLESINAALKPVAEFTDVLSNEKVVTASSVRPVLRLLTNDLLDPSPEDSESTKNLKAKMIAVLKDKYKDLEGQKMLSKATTLDPRYRNNFEEEDIRDELIEEIMQITEDQPENTQTEETLNAGEGASAAPAGKKMNLAQLLGKRKAKATILPKRTRAGEELARYLQEETIDTSDDPLAWWWNNEARYPLLATVAKRYLCICATSTPSERVFSAAGNIVTPIRSSLKPDKVNMLVFLAKNLKSK